MTGFARGRKWPGPKCYFTVGIRMVDYFCPVSEWCNFEQYSCLLFKWLQSSEALLSEIWMVQYRTDFQRSAIRMVSGRYSNGIWMVDCLSSIQMVQFLTKFQTLSGLIFRMGYVLTRKRIQKGPILWFVGC